MFAKIFDQILDSSIADDYQTRHVFMDFLIMADRQGVVDKTIAAIARRTVVPIDIVGRAIDVLCSPDPLSRSDVEEGRRLVLINPGRSWGWRIVNYEQYRQLRDEDARRTYFREYKREYRANKSNDVLDSPTRPTVSTNADADADADAKAKTESSSAVVPSSSKTRDDKADIIDRLFTLYCTLLERSPKQYQLTTNRRDKALLRLEERLEVHGGDLHRAGQDLARAIRTLAANKWNRQNSHIDWLAQIFKSQEEFEKRLNWEAPKEDTDGKDRQHSGALARHDRDVAEISDATAQLRASFGFDGTDQGQLPEPGDFFSDSQDLDGAMANLRI
jgi:hypothetical protein